MTLQQEPALSERVECQLHPSWNSGKGISIAYESRVTATFCHRKLHPSRELGLSLGGGHVAGGFEGCVGVDHTGGREKQWKNEMSPLARAWLFGKY